MKKIILGVALSYGLTLVIFAVIHAVEHDNRRVGLTTLTQEVRPNEKSILKSGEHENPLPFFWSEVSGSKAQHGRIAASIGDVPAYSMSQWGDQLFVEVWGPGRTGSGPKYFN